MGWEALGQWGEDVARIEPLAGGVANDAWRVRVNGHLAVGRLGARSNADLALETELLQHLDRAGLTVPVPVPTSDGRLFADGLVVMTYVEGGPPETEADWRRVADTLRQLHRLTPGWPQRPGWRSSTDLLHAETGTKIDLGAMPPEGVARCRPAWARLIGRPICVVHGNPNDPWQRPHDRAAGRADRLGRVACRRSRPRPSGSLDTGLAKGMHNPVNLRGSLKELPQEGRCESTQEASTSAADEFGTPLAGTVGAEPECASSVGGASTRLA